MSNKQPQKQLNTIGNTQSKQQKQPKRKNIAKQNRSRPDVKLIKINSQKNQKKSHKQKNTQILDQPQLQRAFKVHSRRSISFQQCLFSLKLVGCQLPEKKSAQFQALWNNRKHCQIDFQTFQEIYYQTNSKDILQTNYELFQLLSQGKKVIQLESLSQLAKTANWRGDVSQIMESFGSEGKISFQQFNRVFNTIAALD